MVDKRDLAARVLDGVGAVRALSAVRPRFSRMVTILAYHRVLDVPDEDRFPFDLELVSASVAAFERQMAFLKAHYTPITFATLLGHLDRGEAPPRGSAIVTFDDGFVDNYSHAFPVLRRLGIPATIFLATGYLDRGETFWYERLSHAVMTTRATSVRVPGAQAHAIGPDARSRRRVIPALLRWLKRAADEERRQVLADLLRQLAPEVDCDADPRSGPMTWDQVREMSRAGIEFGSHSVDHPVLSKVDGTRLAVELEASKARIEAELGKAVQVIAYPVGGEEAFDERVRTAVRAAGYRFGVSYIAGVDSPARWDPLALRRLPVERYVSDSWFRATLALPEVFARSRS